MAKVGFVLLFKFECSDDMCVFIFIPRYKGFDCHRICFSTISFQARVMKSHYGVKDEIFLECTIRNMV